MSHLRDQLETAAKDYRSLRYPGDLANDVLDRPAGRIESRSTMRMGVALFVAGAIAAAILLALRTSTFDAPPKPWISRPPAAAQDLVAHEELASQDSETPSDLAETGDAAGLSPGFVPSWADISASTSLSTASPTFTFVGAEASRFDEENSSSDRSTTAANSREDS